MKENMSILLVEDDEVDIMAVKRAFKQNNITNPLFVVNDGEEALAFLRHEGEYAGLTHSDDPRLILLDLHLPRMDGHELLKILKGNKDLCQIPVVILSSSDIPGDVRTSFEYGIAGYMVKPVAFPSFVDMVRTLDTYWTLSEVP